jgi:hypothetical protein
VTTTDTSPVGTVKDPVTYGSNLVLLRPRPQATPSSNLPDRAPSMTGDRNEETRCATVSGVTAATPDLT